MSKTIFEVERGSEGDIVLRFKKPVFGLLSDETRHHLLAAQREVLLALRSMLDTAIEGTEEVQRKTASKTPTKIHVE